MDTRSSTWPRSEPRAATSAPEPTRGASARCFEAATCEPPFEAYNEEGRYEQLERRAEPVRWYRRVPATFVDLVAGCLEPPSQPFVRR